MFSVAWLSTAVGVLTTHQIFSHAWSQSHIYIVPYMQRVGEGGLKCTDTYCITAVGGGGVGFNGLGFGI